jgi:hypothetical protein
LTGGPFHSRGELFDRVPTPLKSRLDWDRVEGMMLGLAVGDALGATTESMLPEDRHTRFGEIEGHLTPGLTRRRPGCPTDDTQMAFWTLEQMIANREFVPEKLADCFCRSRIHGIGNSVRDFIRRRKDQRLPWTEAGVKSAGAERTVLVSCYAIYQGPKVFKALADQMDERPEPSVRMFLNVPRAHQDTASEAELTRRFAQAFRHEHWPGRRLPEVFYDPLALSAEPGPRACPGSLVCPGLIRWRPGKKPCPAVQRALVSTIYTPGTDRFGLLTITTAEVPEFRKQPPRAPGLESAP